MLKDIPSLSISCFHPWMLALNLAVVNQKRNCDIKTSLIALFSLVCSLPLRSTFLPKEGFARASSSSCHSQLFCQTSSPLQRSPTSQDSPWQKGQLPSQLQLENPQEFETIISGAESI